MGKYGHSLVEHMGYLYMRMTHECFQFYFLFFISLGSDVVSVLSIMVAEKDSDNIKVENVNSKFT